MEYIFALFPLLFFSSPVLSSPPLLSSQLLSFRGLFRPHSTLARLEMKTSLKRALYALPSRSIFVRSFIPRHVFPARISRFQRKKHRRGRGGSRSSHAPASTEWRLSPKFLFLPLPFTFFHFSFTFLFFPFLSFFLSLLFPFFSVGRFPFRHCALHHARLFSIFVCFFLFLASVCCRCIIRNNNRNFTESEIVINIPCNEHLSQSWV